MKNLTLFSSKLWLHFKGRSSTSFASASSQTIYIYFLNIQCSNCCSKNVAAMFEDLFPMFLTIWTGFTYTQRNPLNTNVILRYLSIISWQACCYFIMHYINVLSHFYEMCHFIPGKLFLLFKHLHLIQQRQRLCLPMNNELKMTISSS